MKKITFNFSSRVRKQVKVTIIQASCSRHDTHINRTFLDDTFYVIIDKFPDTKNGKRSVESCVRLAASLYDSFQLQL